MVAPGIWKLLHLFFAFSFVGALVVADWNARAARATDDWAQRALLFDIIRIASGVAGLGSLIALGIFGNALAPAAGWHMKSDHWMHVVNGVWLVMVVIMAVVTRPAIGKLAALARAASTGGSSAGYEAVLKRWRIGNLALSLLYLAMLVLMVFRWRS